MSGNMVTTAYAWLNPLSWLTASYENSELEERRAVEAEAASAARPSRADLAVLAPQGLADLPACVRRNLDRVGASDDDFTLVTAQQSGEFRHGKELPWRALSATQVVSPRVPAFFWSAHCGFLPLRGLRGFDCRVGGRGSVDWRFWGWLPALSGSGPLTDRAMLVRWLAEAPGYPQALLPSPLLRWEAVPGCQNKARAVLTHRGTTVAGTFIFNEAGLVASFQSDDYVRPLPRGETERSTWIVRYSGHKAVPVTGALGGGKLVPTEYAAYRVEPESGEEYCYVKFRFDTVEAQ